MIRDKCLESKDGSLFHRLEGEITKIALRDYESALNMIRYLQTENEHLRSRNETMQRDLSERQRLIDT